MLLAFAGLVLLMILTVRVQGATGWHDGTGANSNSLVAWPATNVPPSSSTNRVTETFYFQATSCTYYAFWNLMTNWYQVISTNPPEAFTNDLGSPVSNKTVSSVCYRVLYQPTNASYGVEFTNDIGVAWCGSRPTNRCTTCIKDADDPYGLTCLTNFNADGSNTVASTNISASITGATWSNAAWHGGTTNIATNITSGVTWGRVKFLSDSTDELYRWAWLRWLDSTTPWATTNIAAKLKSLGSLSTGSPFPLYLAHKLADGSTN